MSCLPEPIKTRLVGGFLGAGKTTFILEQLKTAGSKVAVLVNEFGKLGIDGLSVIPKKTFSEEGLADLLAELTRGRFGRIMRGKGFIQVAGLGWLNLQMVAGNVTTESLPTAMAPRLTLIGFDLRAEELGVFLNEPRQGRHS